MTTVACPVGAAARVSSTCGRSGCRSARVLLLAISTMTAIVQVIFGFLVGDYIQKKGKNYEMLSGLFVIGVALMVTGYCWDKVFPINKKIWTSSYVVYTTGLAIMTISTMIYLVELKSVKLWASRFFDVFGCMPPAQASRV